LNIDSTCKETCEREDDEPFQTSVNGFCQFCESPCTTCEDGQPSVCTACIDELPLLYKGTCVDHCPDKYEENNLTPNQCILVGLICPEGFHVDTTGDGCIPNEFECKPGYEINKKNTACIPVPGTPIPFPFLIMGVCMLVVVYDSRMKERTSTRVPTCLIFLFGSMELLEYLLIIVFAASLEQYLVMILVIIATIMLIIANVVFGWLYKTVTEKDKCFKEWVRINPKTKVVIPFLISFVNFKFARFVFSGFFGMDNCQAHFKQPKQAIHRNLKLVTYFKYIFVYIPVFIADLIIVTNIEWGHQLLVIAIETFIL